MSAKSTGRGIVDSICGIIRSKTRRSVLSWVSVKWNTKVSMEIP